MLGGLLAGCDDAPPPDAGGDAQDAGSATDAGPGFDAGTDAGRILSGPEADGDYSVATVDVTVNEIPARLYAPSSDGGSTPDTSIGARPLIVLNPGFGSSFEFYEHFSHHFATWGFVVLGLSYPTGGSPLGTDHPVLSGNVSSAVDWAVSDENPIRALVDPERIVFAGHSLGGKIALLAAADDARVDAVIAWDPVDLGGPPCGIDPVACIRWSVAPERMGDITAPILLFGGIAGPCAPEGENHEAYAAAATSSLVYISWGESDHTDWGIDAGRPTSFCGRQGRTDGGDVHRIARRTQVAWLRGLIEGETDQDRWIDGDGAQVDIDDGTIVVTRRP